MNRVELMGRLVKEPHFDYTPKGYPWCSFTLIVDGEAKWDPDRKLSIAPSNFIACTMFGPRAERVAEEAPQKGERIYVLGELDQSSIEKRDGTKESKTKVKVYRFDRLDAPLEVPEEPPDERPF